MSPLQRHADVDLGALAVLIGAAAAYGVMASGVALGATTGRIVGGVRGQAIIAAWVPAHRAARVDPLVSLRAE